MFVRHYLIRARDGLVTRVRHAPYEWAELFTKTLVWTKTEGDRSARKEADRTTQVKLLFIATVAEHSNLPGFSDLFEPIEYSSAYFDSYWTLEGIEEVEDIDDVAKRLLEGDTAVQVQKILNLGNNSPAK
jgi:hypothetical protein